MISVEKISSMGSEQEVLIAPGAIFQVLEIKWINGLTEITLALVSFEEYLKMNNELEF